MRVLVAASILALAACQPKAEEAAAVAPAPAAEPAPQFMSSAVPFKANSKPAEDVTGNIRLTAMSATGPDDQPSMKLESDKGHALETNLVPGGNVGARNIDWTGVFGDVVDVDDATPSGQSILDIHAVAASTGASLCGAEKTGYLAVAFPITGPSGDYMGIAAFKGDKWPATTKELCGVFTYVPG